MLITVIMGNDLLLQSLGRAIFRIIPITLALGSTEKELGLVLSLGIGVLSLPP